MAVFSCKRWDYYNTVCLNNIKVLRTQIINVIIYILLLYLVKIRNIIIFKINMFISRKPYYEIKNKESSETSCVNSYLKWKKTFDNVFLIKSTYINKRSCNYITYNKNLDNNNDDQFIYWLAGLIDGDGSFLINKNKALTCEITVHERDVKALFKIKEKYHGSVLKRSNVKAYRWRVSKRWIIEKLYNDLNGKLITDNKIKQMKNFSSVLFIKSIMVENYNFNINTGWLSGFIDADGCFTIRNNYTLTISINQKTSGILYSIKNKLQCGNVYFDKRGNTFNYAITDLKGIKKILSYLDKFPLKTTKYIESITFRRLVHYIELKYHYKNNPNKIKIDHLIKLFKSRNKI